MSQQTVADDEGIHVDASWGVELILIICYAG